MQPSRFTITRKEAGFTLLELMISLLITITVIGGVVQMLVVSKSNFVTSRELAAAQENARYALKFIVDEVRMTGFTGCTSAPLQFANSIDGNTWYLNKPGMEGYEHEGGINLFPAEFRADTVTNTDAVVVRRAAATGLRLTSETGATLHLNNSHSFKPGQAMLITDPNCQQVGLFQMTGPANVNNNDTTMVHNKGNVVAPGNCEMELMGDYDCADKGGKSNAPLSKGSNLLELRGEAYYIGWSTTDSDTPALFRERMLINSLSNAIYTAGEELVKGVENMQIFYGLDNQDADGIADIYIKANNAAMDWNNVVSIRLSLRMRSLLPVYNQPESFGEFEGAAGTDGADRFLRQDVSTTITIRNP